MAKMGRPTKEFDIKTFEDLVGLGCTQEEICWFFRDETGRSVNVNTLTSWCKRTFGCTFQEYFRENGRMALKIKLRRNQMKLSEKSAAMAMFLGKNYLGQRDAVEYEDKISQDKLQQILESVRAEAMSETEEKKE